MISKELAKSTIEFGKMFENWLSVFKQMDERK